MRRSRHWLALCIMFAAGLVWFAVYALMMQAQQGEFNQGHAYALGTLSQNSGSNQDRHSLFEPAAVFASDTVFSIISPDERYRINPTTAEPFRKIALIVAHFQDTTVTCSGWFIGLDSVVTAGECLYNPTESNWAEYVNVIPAANGGVVPYGELTSTVYHVPDAWLNQGSSVDNYGVIRLPDTSLGDQVGYWRYAYYSDYLLSKSATATRQLAGYPLDKDYATLWVSSNTLSTLSERVVNYHYDTFNGEQGAPVWAGSTQAPIVFAIHIEDSQETLCAPGLNCGLRITPDMAQNFVLWGAATAPETDCNKLTVLVSPEGSGTVTRSKNKASGCDVEEYRENQVIELLAEVENDFLFLGWEGPISNADNPLSVSVTGNMTVTAIFTDAIAGPLSVLDLVVVDGGAEGTLGNDDGVANCGERIALDLQVSNPGFLPAIGVTASVTTTDAQLRIMHETSLLGIIPEQDVVTRTNVFLIDILTGYEGTGDAPLTIALKDDQGSKWMNTVPLVFYCPAVNASPFIPDNPEPAHNADGLPLDVQLEWLGGDPDGDLVTYDVYFEAEDNSPDTLLCDETTSTNCEVSDLAYETRYYWQVVARDTRGAVVVSQVWTFKTEAYNQPPNPLVMIYPLDGSIDVPVIVTLAWDGDDPDGDPIVFDVFLKLGETNELICHDLSVKRCVLPLLTRGTTYSWYVVAEDSFANTTTGALWTFTTTHWYQTYFPRVQHE